MTTTTLKKTDDRLVKHVAEYFNGDDEEMEVATTPQQKQNGNNADKPNLVRNDIRVLVSRAGSHLTGRQIARVLHGTSFPFFLLLLMPD